MTRNEKSPLSSPVKFGVGQPVSRTEDPYLLRGEGRYTDDIALPRQAYAVIVRSGHAHGVIRSIETESAKSMPGVLGVYTGTDLGAYGPIKGAIAQLKNVDGTDTKRPVRLTLPTDKVRFVGDPIAFVVAETVQQAKDAAEAVVADIDPLPAVIDPKLATEPGAPLLYDDVPNNIALDWHSGDTAKVDEAFARAAHVTKVALTNNRVVVNAMEPRAAIAEFDAASGRYTLHTPSQGVMGLKARLVEMLNVSDDKVRVLTGNVGGSFGMKAAVYPEQICILHAARDLGRPVKWTDERSGSFLSDNHGRDNDVVAELALDEKGHFLAVRMAVYGNMGAYHGTFGTFMPSINVLKNCASMYRTPLIEVATKCVFTNTTFVNPYRGAGRPEGNFYMERLIDTAAAEMGIDRVTMRRRNQIQPSQIPYKAASDQTYDSGDFPNLLKQALEIADVKGFAKRKRESKKRGKLRGLGVGCYLEVTAGPGKESGGIHFEQDGTVTILTGTLDYGQGHASAFAQVLHEKLGVPFERIRLVQGDSDRLTVGGGTGGSRSIMNSGSAIVEAAAKVVERGKAAASHVLEASAADIEFADGRFVIAGTDRTIGIMELAEKLRGGLQLPEDAPASLDVDHIFDGAPFAYPNGCHIAEVEIDPDTGETAVVKYSCVNDFGILVNPMLVEGQIHGGVVQALGQALLEHVVYDSEGQLLSGSYMDYAMPRAHHTPEFVFQSHPTPAKTNPLGVKGCGEAGCAGGLTSLVNAVIDALSDLGVRSIQMPATPHRVWQAIQDAKASNAAKAA